MKIIAQLESKLTELLRTAKYSHPEVFSRLELVLSDSPLLNRAAEIGVVVALAEKSKSKKALLSGFLKGLTISFSGLRIGVDGDIIGEDGSIPLRRMLVDIERVLPLISQLESKIYLNESSADSVFRPANVDSEKVRIYIENALTILNVHPFADDEYKEQLTNYLRTANSELVKDSPNWRKIIGALVIASTVLSGIAAAPEARQNIQAAIQHILGTSIEYNPSMDGFSAALPKPSEG